MKTKIRLTLLFLFVWSIGFSQYKQDVDNFRNELSNATHDTTRVLAMIQLTWIFRFTNPDSAIYYGEKAAELAEKIEFFEGQVRALGFTGLTYIGLGNFPKALELEFKALDIAERKHIVLEARGIALSNIGYAYSELKDYPKAMTYFRRLKNELESDNQRPSVGYAYANINIGTILLETNELDSALFYLKQAHHYFGQSKEGIDPRVYMLLGNTYFKLENYPLALDNYHKSLEIAYKNEDRLIASLCNTLIAQYYLKSNKLDSSIFYAKIGLAEGKSGNQKVGILGAATILSEIYESKDPKESLRYYKIATNAKEDLYGLGNVHAIQAIVNQEDTRRQEIETAKSDYQNQVKQFTLLAGLGTMFLIGFILYRNNRQKQKANAVLENTLAELKETQSQLMEKEQIASAAAVRLQELDSMKTKLYTNITHEFRTPLTVILGMAQQIKDKPNEFMQEGLGMIERNGQNLLNLVNQMLDLSKLESGKLTLHYQRRDVVSFMKYLVESFHSFAESKVVKIHFISDLEELTMDFDETYLQQIVSNLLTNAVKFTPKGGDIYVSLNIQSTTFSFKVRDTGMGISEANLPLIFDRFYQVDDTTTRHGEGTGIGLSLTRELVKLMEGSISVKSQVNKGTEFEVVLPIHHIDEIKAGDVQLPVFNRVEVGFISLEEHPLSINQEISIEKPLILIADDNADVRTYITSCLGTDYNLLIAKDGQECENFAFEHIPDLIVSDVMMPFKDGFEVCKTLKSDERTSHIPIIMLTAKADMDSKLQGLEHGADVYLMKPFNKDELLLRIKKLLELRQQLQQYYRSSIDTKAVYTEGGKIEIENLPKEKSNSLANYSDNAFVIKVRTLIEANLANANFDVEKLCQDLLLSPSQVHRKLTALTGLSTNSFIRYIRLVKAKEMLLKNAHFSISAVAYDSGFNDPAYFSRAFKQEFGMTPQAWREKNEK